MGEPKHELPDIPSSVPSSSHRLPTISGTQALRDLHKDAKGIQTNITRLDRSLSSVGSPRITGGIQRGSVTEVYGPPGSGKTTFAMQLVANALKGANNASHVTWVATGSPMILSRLRSIILATSLPKAESEVTSNDQAGAEQEESYSNIEYIDASSLPRLLTLFLHPNEEFPSHKTSLIVVDDLSNLLFGSLAPPRRTQTIPATLAKDKSTQRAINRRYRVIGSLSSAMAKLAAVRDIPIVVVDNATIAFKNGQRAMLKPALNGKAWDSGITTRIMLYRDFWPPGEKTHTDDPEYTGYRLAKVVRLAGRESSSEGFPFVITDDGIREVIPTSEPDIDRDEFLLLPKNHKGHLAATITNEEPQDPAATEIRSAKRKAIEIADSESEDEGLKEQINDAETLPEVLSISDEEAEVPAEQEEEEEDDNVLLLDEHERMEAEARLAHELP